MVKNSFPVEVFNTCLLLIIHSDLVDRATGNAIINERLGEYRVFDPI